MYRRAAIRDKETKSHGQSSTGVHTRQGYIYMISPGLKYQASNDWASFRALVQSTMSYLNGCEKKRLKAKARRSPDSYTLCALQQNKYQAKNVPSKARRKCQQGHFVNFVRHFNLWSSFAQFFLPSGKSGISFFLVSNHCLLNWPFFLFSFLSQFAAWPHHNMSNLLKKQPLHLFYRQAGSCGLAVLRSFGFRAWDKVLQGQTRVSLGFCQEAVVVFCLSGLE